MDLGGQTPPAFPLELPAELWGRGGGFPTIGVALPIGCDLLAGGRVGALSVRGSDSPHICIPLLFPGDQKLLRLPCRQGKER